jgi:Rap1a immunity proteins
MRRTMTEWYALIAGVAACAAGGTALAQETAPLASEWHGYCKTYVKAIEGDKAAPDLDVTYCLGVTRGLVNGLNVGSQVGALSFGSLLAIRYQIDPDEVFKLFQTQKAARILGICAPASVQTVDYVRTVLGYIDRNRDALQRPIGEVFYDGLQEAWPCD